MMEKIKYFPIFLIILAAISFFLIIATNKAMPKTYFEYSKEEISELSGGSSSKTLKEDFYAWENKAHELSVKRNIPPTTTAKIYAYLATAARDTSIFSGNIDSISTKILCEFYRQDCESIKKESADAYSRRVSEIVFQKALKRMKLEGDLVIESMRAEIPKTGSHVWRGQTPVTPDAKNWMPWHLKDASQFRAPPPPEFGGQEDSKEVQKVRDALENATSEQTKAAVYWASDSPASLWKEISNNHLSGKSLTPEEFLDFKFIFHTTLADAFIACWDTKFVYWTQRPIERGLPKLPTVITPNFPSYTSGHSTISAAAANVLSKYFPENREEWWRLAAEARDSRLHSGVHFDIDNQRGFEMGENLSNYILKDTQEKY